MNRSKPRRAAAGWLVASTIFFSASLAYAQQPSVADGMERLKEQLAAQQAEIQELRKRLDGKTGEAAGTTPAPVSPASPQAPAPVFPMKQLKENQEIQESPLQFHIGSASITPIGFMDFTTVFRTRNGGSSIGTNFASTPFTNTVSGQLNEFRFSAQNSRIGLRVDAKVHGANVLGYLESDFLGASPGNVAVSSNSNTLRMRLYWVDLKKGKYEILGGQSWSLLTPNRLGLSPLPSDLFYSQDVDVNYQLGLVWARNPGFRFVYHPSSSIAMGIAVEEAEQYAGGSAGGGVITLPSALAAAYASQVNTGTNTFGVPNQRPDVVAKIAFDPIFARRHMHIELAGLSSGFKLYNPVTHASFSKQGGGGSVNLNLALTKSFHLLTNNFYSNGGGRYIFGQGPDLIVRGDGTPSLVHGASTVSGFEYQANPNLLVYGYYGGAYFGRDVAIDPATSKPVGYGYAGSPSTNNRLIQEGTVGFVSTFWKDPRYGALQFMGQYSYLTRNPWSVAAGQPSQANNNMAFVNLRYLLPGTAPNVEK